MYNQAISETSDHITASKPSRIHKHFVSVIVVIISVGSPAFAQSANDDQSQDQNKRIFGIIPNYRTSLSLTDYKPLTPKEKFRIASLDSFDRGTVVLAAAFAGQGQLTNANRSFGQGAAGYSRYFGTAYGDFVIGNYMTEAIYPTILHQDPRYFRRGTGSGWSRFCYAATQIFWTHADTGHGQFNFSEIVGNSTAVAISNAYYPENRNAPDAITKLGVQVGVDMAANILKEFSPELNRIFSRRHHSTADRDKPGQ